MLSYINISGLFRAYLLLERSLGCLLQSFLNLQKCLEVGEMGKILDIPFSISSLQPGQFSSVCFLY